MLQLTKEISKSALNGLAKVFIGRMGLYAKSAERDVNRANFGITVNIGFLFSKIG